MVGGPGQRTGTPWVVPSSGPLSKVPGTDRPAPVTSPVTPTPWSVHPPPSQSHRPDGPRGAGCVALGARGRPPPRPPCRPSLILDRRQRPLPRHSARPGAAPAVPLEPCSRATRESLPSLLPRFCQHVILQPLFALTSIGIQAAFGHSAQAPGNRRCVEHRTDRRRSIPAAVDRPIELREERPWP